MQRFVLAAAIVVAVNCGLASADYVLIKIDLNTLTKSGGQTAQPAGGVAGAPGQPGGQGIPGSTMPNVAPPPAFNPKVGGRGKGGFGGGPGFPQQGFPGQPGGMPGQPGQAAAPAGPKLPPLYVYAYVEVKGAPIPKMAAGSKPSPASKPLPFNVWEIDGKVGNQKVKLWVPEPAITYSTPFDLRFAAKTRKFSSELQAALRTGSDDNKKNLVMRLAETSLQLGHLKDFNTAIDELKKLNAKNAIVASVEKTRELLKKKPAGDDPAAKSLADDLRTKEAYRSIISDEGHYTLLTTIEASRDFDADWKKKLSSVEEVYATFFYWWALKGRPQTPPDYRQVIVLVDTPSTTTQPFDAMHAAFNLAPMFGNGFMAQRSNTLVLATRRMDAAYEALDNFNQDQRNKYALTTAADQADLMTNLSKLALHPQVQATNNASAILPIVQTLAVCQKSMNDESEMVALSHGAIRQLVASTGLLPRNVDTAEWARFGLASFFEVPAQSFYPSTGGANWEYLVEFQALRKTNVLERKEAKDILMRVVTDDYFHRANSMLKQLDEAKEDPIEHHKAHEQLELARATAWSLMYFLAQNRDKQLARYFTEIRGLPRDLDCDPQVLRSCFYRAFDLFVPDPANSNRQTVNSLGLVKLAEKWFDEIDKSHLDLVPYENLAVKWRVDDLSGIARPPQPSPAPLPGAGLKKGTPGGVPPGPGGG